MSFTCRRKVLGEIRAEWEKPLKNGWFPKKALRPTLLQTAISTTQKMCEVAERLSSSYIFIYLCKYLLKECKDCKDEGHIRALAHNAMKNFARKCANSCHDVSESTSKFRSRRPSINLNSVLVRGERKQWWTEEGKLVAHNLRPAHPITVKLRAHTRHRAVHWPSVLPFPCLVYPL